MFGIGMPEMLLILAVALIVIGPKKLPDLAKSLGRAMGEFKKATSEIKQSISVDEDLKEVKSSFDDIQKDLKETVTFDNIDEYKPYENTDKRTELTDSDTQSSESSGSDEALGDLKQAFDEYNQESDEPDNAASPAIDETRTDPDATTEEPDDDERGR